MLRTVTSARDPELSVMQRRSLYYVYESYQGFLFFVSTILFFLFMSMLYRHYYPSSTTSTTNWVSRFSSRQPYPPPQQLVTFTSFQPQPGRPVDPKMANSMSVQNPTFQAAPLAAYVDQYGRQSMIPTAVIVATSGPVTAVRN